MIDIYKDLEDIGLNTYQQGSVPSKMPKSYITIWNDFSLWIYQNLQPSKVNNKYYLDIINLYADRCNLFLFRNNHQYTDSYSYVCFDNNSWIYTQIRT